MLCMMCMTIPMRCLLRRRHRCVHCEVGVKICYELKKVIGLRVSVDPRLQLRHKSDSSDISLFAS